MHNIPTKHLVNQCAATAAATTGIFGLGTVLAWSSPSLPNLTNETGGYFQNVSSEQQSWIGSIATLGALASSPVAGFAVERYGRKGSMIRITFPFLLGWLLVGFARDILTICSGRFITGFCGGFFYLCATLYVGEVVSADIRGMLMNTLQLMLVSGILFTYVVGSFVPWQMLTFISSGIPLLFLVLAPFIPESPLFLAKIGKEKKCDKSLNWLHGPPDIRQSFGSDDSKMAAIIDNDEPTVTYRDLLKGEVLKPLLISLSLMILEQASAFNVVIFYSVDIFAQTGTTDVNEYWCSIIVAVVQVVATILGTFLVDRAGRRPLLIISEFVMGLSFVALGIFFYLKKIGEESNEISSIPTGLGWLPLTSVVVFIIAFSIGIGPLSWTVMGEVLHPDVKGLCSAIATTFVWLSAFVVTKIYRTLVDAVGIHWSFWIFASVSLMGTVVVYLCVPETKGKTLEEIQKEFASQKDIKKPEEHGCKV